MKHIQVIDSADNAVYDVFEATDDDFALVFPTGTDIGFAEDLDHASPELQAALERIWAKRIAKSEVQGIHGTLFYGLGHKRRFYPTLCDEEAVNPDGSRLR